LARIARALHRLLRFVGTGRIAALAVWALVPIGGVARGATRFTVPARARQLIVVSSATRDPPGDVATLRAYVRAASGSRWRPVLGPWPAEIGYGHLSGDRHEGDGSTPTGVYGLGATIYGDDSVPRGLHYRYHRLVCGDWWDEDPFSAEYNHFVHVACGITPPFAPGSEALWTETTAYPYFAVIDFNTDPVRGGAGAPGSGIFLHSWVGGPTAGCVAVHEANLLALLRWLRPAERPAIEIGTAAEV
jgi:L,D-peptidoglycan transpeptidase YkuD (ErfK/YbiS/YcfS/YnhG family)